ncbi:hypothetical protein ES288_D10G160400v1 [Gossypium darwinii]|uniref:NFACT RNA-binding domain-containing protein n=1 Tax=Gossypium darwinii TaxID=34276 RepID=A0A5D2B0D5_GOSDA|nr:hypothetical protein ES288_D10G160400v1 [Gossypium darwinii]
MIFYFKVQPEADDYTNFMGLDKYENEELIKYGFMEDIWFHVDKMSFAHLVKASSIQGKKVNDIDVVYTPWSNLKKTPSMDVRQVGFHNSKIVRTVRVEKQIHEIVNRLNKAKVERKPDLKAEKEAQQLKEKKCQEEMQRLEKKREVEIRSYEYLMVSEKMTSNKQIAATSKSFQEVEQDFM